MKYIVTLIFFGFPALFLTSNGQGVGALRLLRNNIFSPTQSYSSGIVEIYYDNTWGNICDDSYFGYSEANVICHQLAFTGVSSYSYVGSTSIYGKDPASSLLEDIDCYSRDYLVLLQCIYNSQYSSYCNDDTRDAFVICYATKIWNSNPYTGQLRIVNGTYSNQGHLQVYCYGQWGTVCGDLFKATHANIACRELGYSDYSHYNYAPIDATASSQPSWLDGALVYCEKCPTQQEYNCINHRQGITLECEFSLPRTSGPYAKLNTCLNSNNTPTYNPSGGNSGSSVAAGVGTFFLALFLLILIIGAFCCYFGCLKCLEN